MPSDQPSDLDRLRASVAELSALNEIAVAIGGSTSLDNISSTIITKCVRYLKAEQGAIFLLDPKGDESTKFDTFVREQDNPQGIPIHLSMNLQGWMLKHKRPLLINGEDREHPLSRLDLAAMGIRSILAAPLVSRQRLSGVVAIFNRKGDGQFTPEHGRFLGIVGTQCAQVIENARLYAEEQRLQLIDRELATARAIQADLLPDLRKLGDPSTVFGLSLPAREVGGDYFDLIELEGGRCFMALGDVAGKGVPAALLMSNALAAQRAFLSGVDEVDLERLASSVNRMLCRHTDSSQYITAVMGILDGDRRTFEYVNAGHHAPVLVTADGVQPDDHLGEVVLGLMPDVTYRVRKVALPRKGAIVLYSDGVTEAAGASDSQFGEERLLGLLSETSDLSAERLCRAVVEAVAAHRGSAPQSDDITVVAAIF